MTFQEIINGLSERIQAELQGLCREQYHPTRDADFSDSYIEDQKARVANLVEIRSHVECIAAGYMEKQ